MNGSFEECGYPIAPVGTFNAKDSNVLTWDGDCNFPNNTVFAFRTWIQIPDYNPVASANRWYIELLNGTNQRSDAFLNRADGISTSDVYATMPTSTNEVAVLRNVAVTMHNVVPYGKGTLEIDFELTRDLPTNGTIELDSPYVFNYTQYYKIIQMPSGPPEVDEFPSCFVVNVSESRVTNQVIPTYEDPVVQQLSELSSVRRYNLPYNPAPDDLSCRTVYYWRTQTVTDADGLPILQFVIYTSRVILQSPKLGRFVKGKYALAISVRNPGPDPLYNQVTDATPCGFKYCFTLVAMYRDLPQLEEAKRIFPNDPASHFGTPNYYLKLAAPYTSLVVDQSVLPWVSLGDSVFLAYYLSNPSTPTQLSGFAPYGAYLPPNQNWLSTGDRIVEYQWEKYASVRIKRSDG